MAASQPLVDLAQVANGALEEARKAIESGTFLVRVYALPRPRLKIRASKRLIEVDEGRMARLEYALFRAVSEAKAKNAKPTFKEYAELVGDYKAAAAYLATLWRMGYVVFDDNEKALKIYEAAVSLSQKGYERRIAKALDATFDLNLEVLQKLPHDDILCVYREGEYMCRYIVANCERSQAKAQVRALMDTVKAPKS
ncbi:hypothetical protein [Hyperthermus butylicus]|uniref:Uncharacterized protein n=1 Tax=Hyperthermus butylicus (strain DSM 5456 / JCM 9403 / PLM1-5) TaxID=415426 RepID=A2BL37_HYPBU|nr:hypothetical protein [Hyperthermus butylicus]ABM80698.1 hypothetical protein Hbut_0847 [Hyperthermus butylicus DSM 5456]